MKINIFVQSPVTCEYLPFDIVRKDISNHIGKLREGSMFEYNDIQYRIQHIVNTSYLGQKDKVVSKETNIYCCPIINRSFRILHY